MKITATIFSFLSLTFWSPNQIINELKNEMRTNNAESAAPRWHGHHAVCVTYAPRPFQTYAALT